MSVTFLKLHGAQETKAMFRHCETEQRLKHEHANKQIDKNVTRYNKMYGALNDYHEACKKYDEYIKELDAIPTQRYINDKGKEVRNTVNSRSDRVTAFGLSITAPAEFDEAKTIEWADKVYAHFEKNYYVVGGALHFDEVHKYSEADTGKRKKSRPHLHIYAIPVQTLKNTDGEEFYRLNGKNFSSKKNMNIANKKVDEISKAMGGTFLTGEKKKSRGTVEELKNRSEVQEAKQIAKLTIKKAKKRSQELSEDNEKKAEELKNKEYDLKVKMTTYKKDKEELKHEQDYQQRRADYLDKREADLINQANVKALQERERILKEAQEEAEDIKSKAEFWKHQVEEQERAKIHKQEEARAEKKWKAWAIQKVKEKVEELNQKARVKMANINSYNLLSQIATKVVNFKNQMSENLANSPLVTEQMQKDLNYSSNVSNKIKDLTSIYEDKCLIQDDEIDLDF